MEIKGDEAGTGHPPTPGMNDEPTKGDNNVTSAFSFLSSPAADGKNEDALDAVDNQETSKTADAAEAPTSSFSFMSPSASPPPTADDSSSNNNNNNNNNDNDNINNNDNDGKNSDGAGANAMSSSFSFITSPAPASEIPSEAEPSPQQPQVDDLLNMAVTESESLPVGSGLTFKSTTQARKPIKKVRRSKR